MNTSSQRTIHFIVLLAAGAIGGCSILPSSDKILPDRKVEYRKSRQAENDLEVPPDLTSSSIRDELVIPEGGSASLASLQKREQRGGRPAGGKRAVLPKLKDIEVERDGDQRWLLIHGDPEEIWFKTLEFWQENGILLEEQDPTIGVMVTDWLEQRPDVKKDFVTSLLSKAVEGLYSASTRDQFRVRIEEGMQSGTTELYLTHRGLQETIIQDGAGTVERTVWNPRPTDHGLEAEMLRRLMVYLGTSDEQATRLLAGSNGVKRKPRSQLNTGAGKVSLSLDEGFDRAWRLVGVALDRVGFAVEDRDRARGVYYVRYNDPMKEAKKKGWLSKLAFWSDDDANVDKINQYQVKLDSSGDTTQLVVLNEQGSRENSDTARRILTLLHEQLK